MEQSTITAKGQTTLPKAVREALGVKPGDTVNYRVDHAGRVWLVPTRKARDIIGILHKDGEEPSTIEEMDEAVNERFRDWS